MFKTRLIGSRVDVDTHNADEDSRLLVAFSNGAVLYLCIRPDLSDGLWVDDSSYPKDMKTFIDRLSSRHRIFRGFFGLKLTTTLDIGSEIMLDALLTDAVAGWKKLRTIESKLPLRAGVMAVHPFSAKANRDLMPYAYYM